MLTVRKRLLEERDKRGVYDILCTVSINMVNHFAKVFFQFNSILLFYLDITYNNLVLIYNVVQTMDDETNNILCTTRHTGLT